jgi:hypothetical protein
VCEVETERDIERRGGEGKTRDRVTSTMSGFWAISGQCG